MNPTGKTHLQESENAAAVGTSVDQLKRKEVEVPKSVVEEDGREKLKRHRVDVAGRVWVPDMWGQEDFLKDWTDCAAADVSLVNSTILLARDSLIQEARRSNSLTLMRLQADA